MKYALFLLLALLVSTTGMAHATTCDTGKVEKCFVDGANTNCICLDQPEDVSVNPAAAPDGQVNEDGGGQQEG